MQRGLVDPCSDWTVFPPPPRSPSAGGVCLLFAIGKETCREAGWIALEPVAMSTDQCLTRAYQTLQWFTHTVGKKNREHCWILHTVYLYP